MRRTGLVYSDRYLKHCMGESHPERWQRLSYTMDRFRKTGILDKVALIEPEPAGEEDILRVHTRELLEEVRGVCSNGGGYLDGDTFCCKESFDVAKLACGGCITAGRMIMEDKLDNAFALVRPPGHHASRNKSSGFCIFNNVAVLARYLQQKKGVGRVFIFDWDAHAANGTMDIFYDDPSVLNVSIHQDPGSFYPGTGFLEQCGKQDGDGYTVNIPVTAGTGDADYVHILKDFVLPLMEKFLPEFVIVSAGQDSHKADDISGIGLTENCFGEMTRLLAEKAEKVCSGRLLISLEGGYELEAFARSTHAILSSLLGVSERYEISGEVQEATDLVLSRLHEHIPHGFGRPRR